MSPQQIEYMYRPTTPTSAPRTHYRPGGRNRRWSTRPSRGARAA